MTKNTHLNPPARPRGDTEVRGFAVYVGIDEYRALADGTTLSELAAELKNLLHRIAPSAETFSSIAVAAVDAGGRDLDIVTNPARQQAPAAEVEAPGAAAAVLIDLSRRRIVIGARLALLTSMEYELLQFLVEREGVTVSRSEVAAVLWSDGGDHMSSRTIDVHVRRLRVKLGAESDLVRTVHGVGYVFNRGSNVEVRYRGR
jgi:DNA-binding response OmpR family regulator